MHKTRRPVRKLKLYAEALEDVSQEGGSSIAQVVEERYVEAAKQVLDLSRELEKSTVGQASEVLKTRMVIKSEP
jgi:hypothetical protein